MTALRTSTNAGYVEIAVPVALNTGTATGGPSAMGCKRYQTTV
ncbi:hypothetical protein PC129_g21313 [Phytophthora cactorum]|uniref:Uncharacterized protein n=1 Tax=Phytophthora cactorum TaxID=29920 RepID=A0A8T0ZJF0_9STRA|nr:hypothetical protein PC111_g4961 [Phytophthora cactorum]KAG2862469.1 hypothetical protein PC113_g6277 [Phytophthora cactorum]KAG2898393.1 hypothetical protein PC114_g14299 [Phytophthora cactorum]KAG3081874.1 hypothetical protein PC121_g6305 [Phytophthora cactorum]KAG3181132.1 hypothetical protein C6341_g6534 [Phytophthora cactorum]